MTPKASCDVLQSTPAQAGMTVLVVDDEPGLLRVTRRLLEHGGYRVRTALNGVDAVRTLQKHRVDVLLSDIGMPEMSGVELVAYAQMNHPGIPRLVMTGTDSVSSVISAVNAGGVFRVLSKPLEAARLLAAVAEALQSAERTARASARPGEDRPSHVGPHAVTASGNSGGGIPVEYRLTRERLADAALALRRADLGVLAELLLGDDVANARLG